MASTVTTTVSIIATLGVKAILAGVASLLLVLFLMQRETAVAYGPRLWPLARNLSVVITALLATFVAIVVSRLGAFM